MRVCASPRLTAIEGGALQPVRSDRRLGHVLAARGQIDADGITRVLEHQQTHHVRFGEAAIQLGLITLDDLVDAITAQYGLPHLQPGDHRFSLELVTAFDPCHPCAEQIRAVRSQLIQHWPEPERGQPLMLAIVSPAHGDGRSYLAANLAVSLAQLGRRTLLIDADLRWPRQHHIFGVLDRQGLATVLGGRADRSAVMALPPFGPLHLLCAGGCPPNPLDLLARDTWPALLRALKREFDAIVVDTPPLASCSDGLGVAQQTGHALIVARQNATRLQGTVDLVNQLRADGVCVMGSVLNAA